MRRCRRDLILAAYTISGLFDLVPLVGTTINNALRLDADNGQGREPAVLECAGRGSLDAVVGEKESAEYFRQSHIVVECWGAAGLATQFGVVTGANHFTAIAPLADPGSAMVGAAEAIGPALRSHDAQKDPGRHGFHTCGKLL